MDKEIIGVVVGAVIGFAFFIFIWYKIIKAILKVVRNFKNIKPDSPEKFVNAQQTKPISGEFDDITKRLEEERVRVKAKTKGLFKRAFLRAWLVMSGTGIILVLTLSEEKVAPIIGISVIGAVLSAIGGGIYTLIKKGINRHNFVHILKKELVSEIVKFVNPDLAFFDEGISSELFKKAEVFNGSIVESEDTIKGTIEGQSVVISECSNRSKTRSSSSSSQSTTTYYTYFDGVFVHLKLSGINLSTPLKIVPTFAIDNNQISMARSANGRRSHFKRINIDAGEKIILDPSVKKGNYEIFCSDRQVADTFVNTDSLKVMDFIFNKYESEKKSLFEGIPLLQNLKQRSGIYISIIEDNFFLMIDWDKDMFEPDAFLNNNLVESGIAQNIHQDIMFINQVIKEVALLSKVSTQS